MLTWEKGLKNGTGDGRQEKKEIIRSEPGWRGRGQYYSHRGEGGARSREGGEHEKGRSILQTVAVGKNRARRDKNRQPAIRRTSASISEGSRDRKEKRTKLGGFLGTREKRLGNSRGRKRVRRKERVVTSQTRGIILCQ